MANKSNGAKYEYFVEGFYGKAHGWEAVDWADTQSEIEGSLATYRENDPRHEYRWRKRRVKPENERGTNEQKTAPDH